MILYQKKKVDPKVDRVVGLRVHWFNLFHFFNKKIIKLNMFEITKITYNTSIMHYYIMGKSVIWLMARRCIVPIPDLELVGEETFVLILSPWGKIPQKWDLNVEEIPMDNPKCNFLLPSLTVKLEAQSQMKMSQDGNNTLHWSLQTRRKTKVKLCHRKEIFEKHKTF